MPYALFRRWSPLYVAGLLVCSLLQCMGGESEAYLDRYADERKQRGVHAFGIRDTTNLDFLRRNHLEWVTLVPWAYQPDFDSPKLRHHRGDSLEIARSDSGYVHRIRQLRTEGFQVQVKPHVWLHEPTAGKWRSEVHARTAEDLAAWQADYRDFILRYARIAARGEAELFCIGTELTALSVGYPEYWRGLIREVRAIYPGRLTYAANWYAEYEGVSFWSDLDYIGVQAYFPLTQDTLPTQAQLVAGWQPYLATLAKVSRRYERPVLFTELGYKSTSDSGMYPWHWIEDDSNPAKTYSAETQARCYAAFFEAVWPQRWFQGVHLWQMRPPASQRRRRSGYASMDFTPLGKPAEAVIRKGFE